jgi:hypothetical protein
LDIWDPRRWQTINPSSGMIAAVLFGESNAIEVFGENILFFSISFASG